MKKKLLTLAVLSLFTSASAQSYLTYVGGDALMHIEDQTLVYSGGGWKVDVTTVSGTDKIGKVDNYGDVMIEGSGSTGTDAFDTTLKNGLLAEFNLKTKTNTLDHLTRVYGQLHITGLAQNYIQGKARKEYYESLHGNANYTGRQQLALPFKDYTLGDLNTDVGQGKFNTADSGLNSKGYGRWDYGSVFKWSNANGRYDQLIGTATNMGNPTDYFIVPRLKYGGTAGTAADAMWNPSDTNSTTPPVFKGKPIADTDLDKYTKVTLSNAFAGSFNGGFAQNAYSEQYRTYYDDPISTETAWSANWGKNLYQLGNPFLTNIDLSLVHTSEDATPNSDGNAITNIEGYFYYDAGSVFNNNMTGSTYTNSNGVKVTVTGTTASSLAGGKAGLTPAESLVIRPMQPFIIKMKDATAATIDFRNTRRFAQTARTATKKYHVTTEALSSGNTVNQLGVFLYDTNGVEIGKTFYVVGNSFSTGIANGLVKGEANATDEVMYTKIEAVNGGAETNTDSFNNQLHINLANAIDFAGKEIPLEIITDKAAKVKFYLIEGGNHVYDGKNLSNGKAFYIKKDNVLTKISNGDEMAITKGSFGLYYEKPTSSTINTTPLLTGETFIGKKDADYIVRFNKNWKSADIEVYTAAGRLVHSNKNVNTNNDYVLPLNNSNNILYVVKVKSESGEIVTKKIIK